MIISDNVQVTNNNVIINKIYYIFSSSQLSNNDIINNSVTNKYKNKNAIYKIMIMVTTISTIS